MTFHKLKISKYTLSPCFPAKLGLQYVEESVSHLSYSSWNPGELHTRLCLKEKGHLTIDILTDNKLAWINALVKTFWIYDCKKRKG